jgi:hypothetical protein
MGSSVGGDASFDGRQDIMSGSPRNGISAVEMPDLMSSPGSWTPILGGPHYIMSGSVKAGPSSVEMPYLMSSPGQWDLSLGGPQDIMGPRRPRSTSWSARQPDALTKRPDLGDRRAA